MSAPAIDLTADLDADTLAQPMRDPEAWEPCPLPHEIPSAEQRAAWDEALAPYRRFIHTTARAQSAREHLRRIDLEQEALLQLWIWGAERIRSTDPGLVRYAILCWIKKARRRRVRERDDPQFISLDLPVRMST